MANGQWLKANKIMWGILFFGVASGILFDVLVGLLGSRRNIGFGWAFIISVLFTPLIGLIATLISSPLPAGSEPKYGCLGYTFGVLGTIVLILLAVLSLACALALLMPMV
jgi:hypothetical protein